MITLKLGPGSLGLVALLGALVARGQADDLAPNENPASRVVVLANSDHPDSLRIARHYAEVRNVPEANVIALRLPLAESISWREFVVTLWEPLRDELVRKTINRLNATPSTEWPIGFSSRNGLRWGLKMNSLARYSPRQKAVNSPTRASTYGRTVPRQEKAVVHHALRS